MNKSDSRGAVVRFCYHSYDYRPNWTPLSPITNTNNTNDTNNNNSNNNNSNNNNNNTTTTNNNNNRFIPQKSISKNYNVIKSVL